MYKRHIVTTTVLPSLLALGLLALGSLALGSLALAATGCDPGFNLRGRVTSGADEAGVEGAKVSLYCYRDGEMRQFYPSFSTDAQGRFVYQDLGELSVDCELRAEKEGFQVVDVPLREACTKRNGEEVCVAATFDIELSPAPESR